MTTSSLSSSRATTLVVVVGVLSVLLGIPTRDLDWKGTIVPLAQSYASSASTEHPLQGKVVVITGCTNGIGLSLARSVHKLGAQIVGVGRNSTRLSKLREELDGVQTVQADLSNLTASSFAADEILGLTERIDVLVHNAGIHDLKKCLFAPSLSVEGRDRTFTVNYLAPYLLTEKLTPALHHNGTVHPTVVHVSSFFHWSVTGADLMPKGKGDPRAASGGPPGFSFVRSFRLYSNSKLAQIYHTRALRKKHASWSKRGRILAVDPGWVQGTGMTSWFPFGFNRHTWALASVLLGMLDISTCHGSNCDGDYYSNSCAPTVYGVMTKVMPKGLMKMIYPRMVIGLLFGVVGLCLQKITQNLGPSKSSAESYDELVTNALYYWTANAIHEFL